MSTPNLPRTYSKAAVDRLLADLRDIIDNRATSEQVGAEAQARAQADVDLAARADQLAQALTDKAGTDAIDSLRGVIEQNRDRSQHRGTQGVGSVEGLQSALNDRVQVGQAFTFGYVRPPGSPRHMFPYDSTAAQQATALPRDELEPTPLGNPAPPPETVPVPVNVTTTQTASTATITWQAPAGAAVTGYRIARDGTDSDGAGAYSALLPASALSVTFAKLRPASVYNLTVATVTSSGESAAVTRTVTIAAAAVTPTGTHKSGVYCGFVNPTGCDQFGAARGRPVGIYSDVFDLNSYANIANPTAWVNGYGPNRDMAYGLAPVVNQGGSLANVAAGQQDATWGQLARTMIAGGQADAWVRIGYEFNGGQFPWNAQGGRHTAFIAAWRRIVDIMRAQPGAAFKFTWNPMTRSPNGFDALLAWPGDAYVDGIGLDIYDESFAAYTAATTQPTQAQRIAAWDEQYSGNSRGILYWLNYGAAKGIPINVPEWGLVLPGEHRGGGDNVYFVEKMHELCNRTDVIWDSYYNVAVGGLGDSRLASYPNAFARYKQLFGTQGVA